MTMPGSANSKDVIIPKGIVVAYPINNNVVDPDGIDLGYTQEADFTIAETTRQVYSARDNTKSLAVDKVTKVDYTIPLSIISTTPDNLAMLFRGKKGTQNQLAGSFQSGAGAALAAPSALERTFKINKRALTITKVSFQSGTAAFTVGSQLSTGASTGEIVWVDGDVANGNIYVVGVSGSEFVDAASLVDDGGTPGAAAQFGDAVVEKDIVLTNTGASTRYMLGTDYDLDEKSGTVFVPAGSSIMPLEVLEGYFDHAALTEIVVNAGAVAPEAYRIEVLPFSDETENRYEMTFWKCTVKADTTIKMVTAGEEEVSLGITLTPLANGPGATSVDPIFKQVLV